MSESGLPNSYTPVSLDWFGGTNSHTVHHNGWKIEYALLDTDAGPDSETLSIADLVNGRFELIYRPIFASADAKVYQKMGIDHPDGTYGCLTYGMSLTANTKRKSSNRPFFGGLGLNRYIPKLHFFT